MILEWRPRWEKQSHGPKELYADCPNCGHLAAICTVHADGNFSVVFDRQHMTPHFGEGKELTQRAAMRKARELVNRKAEEHEQGKEAPS